MLQFHEDLYDADLIENKIVCNMTVYVKTKTFSLSLRFLEQFR
jgi:hypothetical protein